MEKVIIFYPHIGEFGGIERNILALAEESVRRGVDPVLLCFYDKVGMKRRGVPLEVVQLGDSRLPWAKAGSVRTWLGNHAPGIQGLPLCFGDKAGFYAALGAAGSYALHYTDPPSLLTPSRTHHGIAGAFTRLRRAISGKINARGVAGAKVRLTMTHWNAAELKQCFGYDFEVIYQGGLPPGTGINPSPRGGGPVLRLFSLCRLSASKHLDWILDSAKRLGESGSFAQRYSGIEVILAGKGPEEERLRQRAKDLGIERLVKFPGFLDESGVEAVFAASDLFLVPGRQGFGLPVLEALYRRVPVVVNRESRISEMLESNPWVAVSDNSSEAFTGAVLRHLEALSGNYPGEDTLSDLPTEPAWAAELGSRCGWW